MSVKDIITGVNSASNAANAANTTRYRQGLGVTTHGANASQNYLQQAVTDTAGYGESAKRDINENYAHNVGAGTQNLISGGLSGTTILGTMQQGAERNRSRDLADLSERQSTLRAGLRGQQAQSAQSGANSIAGFIAGRNDTGPDVASYGRLLGEQSMANASNPTTPRVATVTNRPATDAFGRVSGSGGGSTSSSGGSPSSGGGSGAATGGGSFGNGAAGGAAIDYRSQGISQYLREGGVGDGAPAGVGNANGNPSTFSPNTNAGPIQSALDDPNNETNYDPYSDTSNAEPQALPAAASTPNKAAAESSSGGEEDFDSWLEKHPELTWIDVQTGRARRVFDQSQGR
jgi:hypothetical protein